MKMRVVSGGQTGVDRAALDVALKYGVDCGGWCPKGRADETGRIPDKYPVAELPGGSFDERTLQNVIDSDGTVIFHSGELHGGSAYTLRCCEEQHRPHLVIDAQGTEASDAVKLLRSFIRENDIRVLNVGGPRQSEWPGGYDYCYPVLELFLMESRSG
jgi:hypothetical protein